jgi:hypothetical protein
MDRGQFELAFKIIDRVIFDLLVNSSSNGALKDMTDQLLELLGRSDEAVVYLARSRVFAAAETLGKDEKNFFEMLASHQDKNVREMASRTLLYLLNRLHAIGGEGNQTLIEDSIAQLLDLMPNECQKHWLRLETYLSFFLELAKSNFFFLVILAKKNTVRRLMDLMSKYNQNTLAYIQTNPPLDSLVAAVSFIVRSIPCLIDPSDPLNQMNGAEEIDKATMMALMMEDRGSSDYHLSPLQSYSGLQKEDLLELVLPDECLKAVFLQSKQFKIFYENSSKYGYEVEDFSLMVAHACFKNKQFSRKMAKHILKGTNTSSADEIVPYLDLMKTYLQINDEYFEVRMEWVFGISDIMVKTNYSMYSQTPKLGVVLADSVISSICRYFSPIFKNA